MRKTSFANRRGMMREREIEQAILMSSICLQTAAMYGVQGYSDRALSFAMEAFDYIGELFSSLKAYYYNCNVEKNQRYEQLTSFFSRHGIQ